MNIKSLSYYQTNTEWQVFDRKSVRIACKDFAELIVAFANADGGEVVIGIEDDGAITGVDDRMKHLNELLRVPFDYCIPSAQSEAKMIDCTDRDGKPNHVVVMQIYPVSSCIPIRQMKCITAWATRARNSILTNACN